MSGITAAGNVPATILENTPTNAWAALLTLQGSLTGLREVALTGADANRFQAVLLPGEQVRITPAMVFDREAFGATDPVFAFSLSLRFDSGWVAVQGSWSVTLRDVDDTAPGDLRFAAGGSVRETAVGGVIGTLAATDPDSPAGNITYSLGWPDEAWFEIVDGNVLKLRDGVDLLREGGTTREVVVLVSDGINTAARIVSFQVLNETDEDDLPAPPPVWPPPEEPPPEEPPPEEPPPEEPPPEEPPPEEPPPEEPPPEEPPPEEPPPEEPPPEEPPPEEPPPPPPPPPPPDDENRPPDPLQPGETKHGFAFIWPTVIGTLRFSWEAELALTGPDGLTLIRLADGNDVWLPPIDLLHMGDGDLHFAADGVAAQIIRLYDAVLDRPPDVPGLRYYIDVMRAGTSLADVAAGFLNSPEFVARFGGLSNADLVTALYRVALGREPDAGGFAFHVAELNDGMPRQQKIANFLQSPEAAGLFAAANPGGVFVPIPNAPLIAAAYDAVFDRPPDQAGLAFWSDLLVRGVLDARGLVSGIAQSQEFQQRHAGSNDAQYVTSIYASALERPADTAGLAFWTGLLADGTLDRVGVVMAIGLSPEGMSQFTPPNGAAFDLFG